MKIILPQSMLYTSLGLVSVLDPARALPQLDPLKNANLAERSLGLALHLPRSNDDDEESSNYGIVHKLALVLVIVLILAIVLLIGCFVLRRKIIHKVEETAVNVGKSAMEKVQKGYGPEQE